MNLTNEQEKAIKLFAKSKLAKKFYWTGGTLLAYHYLKHRKSLDLDFFSEERFSFEEVNELVETIKKQAGFRKVHSKKIFDRWEFLFENDRVLRIEFVYYNQEKKTLRKRKKLFGVFIDSLVDIAANKTMAHFDRNEPKDLFDLYFLLTKEKFTVEKLLALTNQKFGVQFGESLFWSEAFKSIPLLHSLKPLMENHNEKEREDLVRSIGDYFRKESAKFLRKQLT